MKKDIISAIREGGEKVLLRKEDRGKRLSADKHISAIREAGKRQESLLKKNGGIRNGTAFALSDRHILNYEEVRENLSAAAEEYRAICVHIDGAFQNEDSRTIVVTSASGGEGKTLTAANIAVTFAEDMGRKVLLIDADMRKGKMHKLFGAENSGGLNDLFNTERRWRDVIKPSMVERLDIIVNGRSSNDFPLKGFPAERMKALIDEMRSDYEYIFIDIPPLLPVADGRMLSGCVDGVVLIVQANRTRREVVQKVQSVLDSIPGTRSLGFILTQREHHIPSFIYSKFANRNDFYNY